MGEEVRLADGMRRINAQEVELADTTTGTSGVSSVIAEQWLQNVVQDAEANRRFRELSREYDDLVNSGDDKLHIPKSTKHLDISATGVNEGADRTFTKMDSLDTVDVTIGSNDWYKGGISISKEAVLTSNVELLTQARYHVAQEIAQDIDIALRDIAQSNRPSAHKVDQTGSGELTPDSISKAMEYIETDDFVPEALVVGPGHQHDLRTDSQFTNAAEFGDDRVVRQGQIGEYLGLDVLVSSNISNEAVMIGSQPESGMMVGPALVWKEMPNVGVEYQREDAEHHVYYDQAFATATIQDDALATIKTS